jgi:hypothetical protein
MDIIELLKTYSNVIFEFLFEIYIFYILITKKLKRKENFQYRFYLGLIVILILSFLITIFYQYYGTKAIGRVLVYTSIFILTVGHLKFCYDEDIWSVILCSVLGYAAQNLVYKIFLTIWTCLLWFKLFDGWETAVMFSLHYRLLYYFIFGMITFVIYKLFISKIFEKLYNSKLKYQLLIIAMSVLLVTNILCSLEDIYFMSLSSGRENEFNNFTYFILRQTGNLFSIVCCVLVIILITLTLEKDSLKQKVEYLQHTIRNSQRQYEISRDTINLINIKCHDIKYKIEASLNDKKEFDSINEMIAIYDSKIETGNDLLDVLFTEKSLYCEQNNIKFSAMVDGAKLDFIEAGDLYCLFGNLTDNALEAVAKIANKEKRIINIIVKMVDNMLIIQEENYYDGNINFDDDGLPITSKENKDYHGFGIQSIKLLVEKYHGVLTTFVNDDVFHLNILFNLHNIQNK